MTAVRSKLLADVRRRRLQAGVVLFVVLLSSAAATLGVSLAVETTAPYDQAFARAHGPHLALTFDASKVSPMRLAGNSGRRRVVATSGPWPGMSTVIARSGPGGSTSQLGVNTMLVGRRNPQTSVDRLTIESGHWPGSKSEIALSQSIADDIGAGLGTGITLPTARGHRLFRVSAIAASVSPVAGAWVQPRVIRGLTTRQTPLEYLMLYRVSPARTASQLRAATQQIAARLPAGSVVGTSDYLSVKRDADVLTSVMIPFLLAFAVFALLASVLIVTNIISGLVLTGYRDIGLMKAIGFTPNQVVAVILGQVLGPALLGAAAGAGLGTLAARPFLQNTAHALGLPTPSTATLPVDAGVVGLILVVVIVAGLGPAWRAGRLAAIAAITKGQAPAGRRASVIGRLVGRAPLIPPLSLGLETALVRPARSMMTLAAIVVGVASIVFALDLHLSLGQVAAHLDRSKYVQLELNVPTGPLPAGLSKLKGGFTPPPPPSRTRILRALKTTPGIARYVSESQSSPLVPGIAEPVTYFGYDRPSSWLGYALISGRWFRRPGEVVAPTRLLTQAHLHVGSLVTLHLHGRAMRVRIVGEILDQSANDMLFRGAWRTERRLDPTAKLDDYEIQVRPGSNPSTVGEQLGQSIAPHGFTPFSIDVRGGADVGFLLLNGIIASLAAILIAIALAGIFATVILSTREKGREIAILKAVGMPPAQVVAMVMTSAAILGILAGPVGLPIGTQLHRQVIQIMGQAASSTRIPPSFFNLIPMPVLVSLGATGAVLAIAGAWLPAQWASSAPVAEILQAE